MELISAVGIDSIVIKDIEIPLGNTYKENFKARVISEYLVDRNK